MHAVCYLVGDGDSDAGEADGDEPFSVFANGEGSGYTADMAAPSLPILGTQVVFGDDIADPDHPQPSTGSCLAETASAAAAYRPRTCSKTCSLLFVMGAPPA